MRIVTIGGYGFTEASFLDALRSADVDTFIDVRQRRGMRGAKYAFLNSSRLQDLLRNAGIKYIHELNLAPTSLVRDAQKDEDRTSGIAKRDRKELSPSFISKYRSEILDGFVPTELRQALRNSNVVALFCVETHPSACHRSLAAEHLMNTFSISAPVEHLKA